MEGDYSHRISASALQRRGLVTKSGRGPTWSASVIPAGREYLETVDGEEPPVARQANKSVTQQLVDDVIAAGGALRMERRRWYGEGGVDWVSRALLAERYGKVPAGRRLEVVVVSDEEFEIRLLEDAPLSTHADEPDGKYLHRCLPVDQAGRDRGARPHFRT